MQETTIGQPLVDNLQQENIFPPTIPSQFPQQTRSPIDGNQRKTLIEMQNLHPVETQPLPVNRITREPTIYSQGYYQENYQPNQEQIQKLKRLVFIQGEPDDQRELDTANKLLKYFYYMIAFFQIGILGLYPIYLFLQGLLRSIITLVILSIISIVFILFILTIWKKSLIHNGHNKIFLLIFGCVCFLAGAVASLTQLWYLVLIFMGLSTILYIVLNFIVNSSQNDRKRCLGLNMVFSFCAGCIGSQIFMTVQNSSIFLFYTITTFVMFALLAKLMFCMMMSTCCQDSGYDQAFDQQRFVGLCVFYIASAGISLSSTSLFMFPYSFFYLTIPMNLMFVILTLFYFLRVAIYSKPQKVKTNLKVYQKSDILLSLDINDISHPRISVASRPLARCTLCLSEEARFYYEQCMHICCGHRCVLRWLQSRTKECPQCRKHSEIMVEIKRVGNLQFEVVNKYKFSEIQPRQFD